MSKAPDLGNLDKYQLREILEPKRFPVKVAVYGSENYFNLGAIIRVAHGFLCKELIAIECPAYYKKAAMGCNKWEAITNVSIEEFLETNKTIVAYERREGLDSQELYHFEYPENPTLVFGSEKFGIPERILEASTAIVSIPMYGLINDMNLANAVSIAIYDWHAKNAQKSRKK
jgi:tRNA G18 (ribose-2'-O)-methylase SpoU